MKASFGLEGMTMGGGGMNMNTGNSGNATDIAGNSMTMVFDSWDTYQLQILFSTWNVQTQWQFALSWFSVAFAVIVYRYLDCVAHHFHSGMKRFLTKPATNCDSTVKVDAVPLRPIGWLQVKIIYGLLTAAKYSLSLFLMLIAMTYNPNLFVALFVGYFFGEVLFTDKKLDLYLYHNSQPFRTDKSAVGQLIVYSLGLPLDKVDYLRSTLYPDENNDNTLKSADEENESSIFMKVRNYMLWLMPRVISAIFLVILIYWIVLTQGGFDWTATGAFGWHALLMSFFVVMFSNEAILTYKAPLVSQISNSRTWQR